jgi:anti-anti-sigma factor
MSPLPPVTCCFESLQPVVTILIDRSGGWSCMHGKHQGLQRDGSALRNAALQDALSRLLPPPVKLARAQPNREPETYGHGAAAERRQPVVAGQLAVRWERQDAMSIMWLSGALDRATVTLLDREIDGRAIGLLGLVVDLTGLHFIDSSGLDALVGIHWRASKRGDRLSFRHGTRVAQRPVELTRTVRARSRWAARAAGASNDDFYFALAMACVDVDHSWSGDRPEAA